MMHMQFIFHIHNHMIMNWHFKKLTFKQKDNKIRSYLDRSLLRPSSITAAFLTSFSGDDDGDLRWIFFLGGLCSLAGRLAVFFATLSGEDSDEDELFRMLAALRGFSLSGDTTATLRATGLCDCLRNFSSA